MAFKKLRNKIKEVITALGNHSQLVLDDGTNPHGTTKGDVGLGNADNTSDADKPVSTAQQTEINTKEDSFAKNSAFNKSFGTGAGNVLEGNTTTISPTQAGNITTNNAKVSFPEAPNDGQEYVRKSEAWSVATGGTGGGGTIQFQIGTTISSGAASSGISVISNEIVWSVSGGGGGQSKRGYWNAIVPKDYASGGELNIRLRTTDITLTTLTMSLFINDVVDATINAFDITPSADNVFEDLFSAIGSTIVHEDRLSVHLDFMGANGDDIDVKAIYFDYD